jgi:hypothetical protein
LFIMSVRRGTAPGTNPGISRSNSSIRRLAVAIAAFAALAAFAAAPASRAPATTRLDQARLTSFLPHDYGGTGVVGFGSAKFEGAPTNIYLASPLTTMAVTSDGGGYWLGAADGGVFSYGDAHFYGSAGNLRLYAPIVGMAATPNGKGYWMVAADGGIFAYGDAHFYGSMGGRPLNQPIVGMAATPNGKGYWLVASDGGIFAFGDAHFYGSMGGHPLNEPIIGMAAVPGGKGYWLAAADGGVFAFGRAPFDGSMGSHPPYDSVTGITANPRGGYWMVDWDGNVYGFGQKPLGGLGADIPAIPVTAIASTPDGQGYWLLAPQDFGYTFGDSPVAGSQAGTDVVAAATSQVGGDPDLSEGPFCNPYGPCEQWCALFASWSWNAAGVSIPDYPFVGDFYGWGASLGVDLPGNALPRPGDAILYGTGPDNAATSPHMGIVAEVWPDGEVVTIEGDAGPGQTGQLNVVVNGPFMPADSNAYNGFPVYAYVDPP